MLLHVGETRRPSVSVRTVHLRQTTRVLSAGQLNLRRSGRSHANHHDIVYREILLAVRHYSVSIVIKLSHRALSNRGALLDSHRTTSLDHLDHVQVVRPAISLARTHTQRQRHRHDTSVVSGSNHVRLRFRRLVRSTRDGTRSTIETQTVGKGGIDGERHTVLVSVHSNRRHHSTRIQHHGTRANSHSILIQTQTRGSQLVEHIETNRSTHRSTGSRARDRVLSQHLLGSGSTCNRT